MSPHPGRPQRGPDLASVGLRVVAIGAGIVAMTAVVLQLAQLPGRLGAAPAHPAVPGRPEPAEPIPSEALVFRLAPGDLAVGATTQPRAPAHRRTLARYRGLRAYPGAPPRIPHGLTPEEYRDTGCGTCHERGGYAPRFAAYAPATPHPEYASCLQCHLPDASLVRTQPPPGPEGESCRQCHADPDAPAPTLVPLDWRAGDWPRTGQRAMEGSPPMIPHDLQLRGNCLACHGGPSAVVEIRTTHPERANCRQCHVPVGPGEDVFTRPLEGAMAPSGTDA